MKIHLSKESEWLQKKKKKSKSENDKTVEISKRTKFSLFPSLIAQVCIKANSFIRTRFSQIVKEQ